MKKCPKCQQKYTDDLEKCLDCDITLEEYQDPKQVMLTTILEKYKKEVVIIALIISFILGFGFKSCIGIKKSDYEALLAEKDRFESLYNTKTKDFDYYKSLMQPYEEQQKNDAKIAEEKKLAEEKAKKEAEEKAAAEKAAAEKAAQEAAYQKAIEDLQQETTSSVTGVMPKNYKPTGKEPNWIEIISYCEVQMPKVIGYDASISLDENDTKVIRTGLRYKIETDSLKIKADKSYHKAIFIIEFENENYENFRVDTAEVDGVKIR